MWVWARHSESPWFEVLGVGSGVGAPRHSQNPWFEVVGGVGAGVGAFVDPNFSSPYPPKLRRSAGDGLGLRV